MIPEFPGVKEPCKTAIAVLYAPEGLASERVVEKIDSTGRTAAWFDGNAAVRRCSPGGDHFRSGRACVTIVQLRRGLGDGRRIYSAANIRLVADAC
jgi:hypothetical protein